MSASAVLNLQKVGFTIEQVEALADFMDTQGASKADLFKETAAIRADLEGAEHRLETRIIETRSELRADLEGAEHRLETRIIETRSELKADIAAVKADLLKTIIGAIALNAAAVFGAMFGLAKLLGH
jgi:hypothetical protein